MNKTRQEVFHIDSRLLDLEPKSSPPHNRTIVPALSLATDACHGCFRAVPVEPVVGGAVCSMSAPSRLAISTTSLCPTPSGMAKR